MKLSIKLAGLLGSGVFLLTLIPGFYQLVRPTSMEAMIYQSIPGVDIVETLMISLIGAMLAGVIGYMIGDILSKPQGPQKRAPARSARQPAPSPSRSPAASVTGEETFLDDLDKPAGPSGGAAD